MKLDKFDISILEALQKDARLSLQDLGKIVGLTASPCWTRVKRLEDAGIIEGYTVRLSPEKLGLPETVILHVSLDSHSDEALFEFGRALESIPEVLEAFLVSGDYDYYIRVAVEDTRGYERFLREKLYKMLARNTHAPATSLAQPSRDKGMPAMMSAFLASSSLPWVISVSINPGAMQFTRMPSPPNSRAMALASPRIPALAAE